MRLLLPSSPGPEQRVEAEAPRLPEPQLPRVVDHGHELDVPREREADVGAHQGGELLHALRTGQEALEVAFGERPQHHPELARPAEHPPPEHGAPAERAHLGGVAEAKAVAVGENQPLADELLHLDRYTEVGSEQRPQPRRVFGRLGEEAREVELRPIGDRVDSL